MAFDVKKEVSGIVDFVRDYYKKNNLGGAVLGISGGKDSAVVLAILVEALGKENVVGLTLPCHSISKDKDLAHVVCDHYGVKLYNLDLTSVFDAFTSSFKEGYGQVDESCLIDSNINLKPRLRTASVYYYAAMLSRVTGKPYLVAGTSNKCELFVGYFTKGGDNVHDIATIADFTVSEVIKIGEYLNVPREVLYRVPSDGLSNMSDEEKLGVKYSQIEQYFSDKSVLDESVKNKIEKLHNSSRHKFNIPTYRQKKRIAVYPGSFNPIHNAHLDMAKRVLKDDIVDEVVIVPAGDGYEKKGLVSGTDRCEMIKRVIEKENKISVSDIEVINNKVYTYETLDYFNRLNNNDELYLIMGSDNLIEFNTWKEYEYILNNYNLIVFLRNGQSKEDFKEYHKDNIMFVEYDAKVSSTEIRDCIKKGNFEEIENKVDENVLEYIKQFRLYE